MPQKLISEEQIASIKSVLNDVTYTFFTSDITLKLYKGSMNRWGEDNETDDNFSDYVLKGGVEFGQMQSDKDIRTETGSDDNQSIEVSFNFKDLKAQGLTKGNSTIINPSTDYLVYEGSKYAIGSCITDGFLDSEPVLVLLNCSRTEIKT